MKKINSVILLTAVSLLFSAHAFAADEAEGVTVDEPKQIEEVSATTATLAPKFDLNSNEFEFGDTKDDRQPTEVPGKVAEPEKTAEPAPTPDSTSGTENSKEIRKVCGVDIPPGRYNVSGSGVLMITSSNGQTKSEDIISPTDKKNTVVLLEEGDILKMTPLEGEEKSKLKFDKAGTDPSDVTAVKKDDDKTNPKTGDNDELAVIGVLAVVAVAALGLLEVIKRKKKNSN